MTGDLSKFAPSLSQRYGIDLNVAQGGLPTVGKTEKVGGIEVDKLPEALKNLIQQRDKIAADEQERKDNPLVPQTGFTRTSETSLRDKRIVFPFLFVSRDLISLLNKIFKCLRQLVDFDTSHFLGFTNRRETSLSHVQVDTVSLAKRRGKFREISSHDYLVIW